MARLSGSRGSIYLAGSGTKLADSYLWEFEETQEVLDASIKGEQFRRYVADQGHARVRIQSFVAVHGAGTRVAFILETVNVSNVAGITVQGSGYLIRSMLHVARDGILTDEIEIEVDGALTTVV
jgi:hypothetical protein